MNPCRHNITRATPHLALMLLAGFVLVSCGGGSGAGTDSSVNLTGTPQERGLEKIRLNFNGAMEPGQEVVVTLSSPGILSDVRWELAEQPSNSVVAMTPSADLLTATVTPPVPGEYLVKLTAKVDGAPAELTSNFLVMQVFPYEVGKIRNDTPGASPADIDGIVLNQIYVSSLSKSEQELRTMLMGYPRFVVLGYESGLGLLVKFDDTDPTVQADMKRLSLEQGVYSVYHRVHRGRNVPRANAGIPPCEKDLGCPGLTADQFLMEPGNWHFKEINAIAAWENTPFETTPGLKKFLIGVVDRGFNANHEDMNAKFLVDFAESETRSSDVSINDPAPTIDGCSKQEPPYFPIFHGNSVSSIISANTNNWKGMSGINSVTSVIAANYQTPNPFSALTAILTKKLGGLVVPLVNNSWGLPIPCTFDPTIKVQRDERHSIAVEHTRDYRSMAGANYTNKLFIWAAGNGIGNGAGNNAGTKEFGVDASYSTGAIQLQSDQTYSELKNVIVVAALEKRGSELESVLVHYSNFGETVDIAAPTSIKAATGVNNIGESMYDSRFGGTSAAAPVVTGAASLIYGLNPEFSAEQVKAILISSTTKKITKRYTDPKLSTTEQLAKEIPILNMGAATEYAKKLLSSSPVIPSVNTASLTPALGSTSVAVGSAISVAFNTTVDASTLDTSTFMLSSPSGSVAGRITYNAATDVATFTPLAHLTHNTAYTVTLTTGVKNLVNPLASIYTWEFTTAGAPPSAPTGISATAGNGQSTISWNAVTGAVAYNVYVASVSGVAKTNYGSLADGMQHAGVASPYTRTGLINDKSYYFVVTAVGASGESSVSSQVLVTPQASPTNGGFTVSGSVMDENNNSISNAVVELVANGIKYSTTSDSDGLYSLHLNSDQASHLPATFAVNAYEPINHNPSSKGFLLSAGNKVVNNFVLPTVSGNPQLVTIDLVPEIHHIGNSSFAGAQNSQFQFPTAEAATFARSFSISAAQKVYASADLTFIAKGVQCRDEVWLNTVKVRGLQNSDQRGAFTSYTVPFDPSILVQGSNNTFQIKSVVCSGRDTDDFEFSNVQINFR